MALSRSIFVLAVTAAIAVAQDAPKVDVTPGKADALPSGQPKGDRPSRPDGPPSERSDGPRREGREGRDGKDGRDGRDRDGRDGRHRPKLQDEKTVREQVEKNLEEMTPEKRKEFWGAVSSLFNVPPDQRGEFWRAVWAVNFMPPEQKTKIIGEGEERRKVMKEEVDRVFADVGLTKEDPRRREFYMKYFGGRKEMEEKILKESNERRQALLKDLEAKLKQEFAKPAAEKVELK